VTAPNCQRLITHTFVAGDSYLESDAVFGVKAPLIVKFEQQHRDNEPRWRARFDFVLPPA
jgi:catechol 1,2-dioxygenase